ncbi:MAG: hypothetical protein WD069_20460 [Planctomycetales bacterium]
MPASGNPTVDIRQAKELWQEYQRTHEMLANGQAIDEKVYLIEIEFDERRIAVETTFAAGTSFGMIGTRLLTDHCLQIDFRTGAVSLSREAPPCEVVFKVVTSQDAVAER